MVLRCVWRRGEQQHPGVAWSQLRIVRGGNDEQLVINVVFINVMCSV